MMRESRTDDHRPALSCLVTDTAGLCTTPRSGGNNAEIVPLLSVADATR